MASIPQTQKKLRECAFFLHHLSTTEGTSRLETEESDFFLSAFLSAARSVTFVLQVEEGDQYKTWFPTWKTALDDSDRELLAFMNEQRRAEVHMEGASVERKIEMIPVTRIDAKQPSHPGYGMHSFGPPGTPPPTIGVRVGYFDGNPEQAVNTCRRYLHLLQKLVNDFQTQK